MLTERLHTSNSSFIDRLLAVDYFLIFIVVAIGAISVFAIHSTEGGEFSYYTKNHLIRLIAFFGMFFRTFVLHRFFVNFWSILIEKLDLDQISKLRSSEFFEQFGVDRI